MASWFADAWNARTLLFFIPSAATVYDMKTIIWLLRRQAIYKRPHWIWYGVNEGRKLYVYIVCWPIYIHTYVCGKCQLRIEIGEFCVNFMSLLVTPFCIYSHIYIYIWKSTPLNLITTLWWVVRFQIVWICDYHFFFVFILTHRNTFWLTFDLMIFHSTTPLFLHKFFTGICCQISWPENGHTGAARVRPGRSGISQFTRHKQKSGKLNYTYIYINRFARLYNKLQINTSFK